MKLSATAVIQCIIQFTECPSSYASLFHVLADLARRIIVDIHSEIVEHELNPPCVYLRSLVQNLSSPKAGMVVRNMSAQGYMIKPLNLVG